jgi:hypothetical protein
MENRKNGEKISLATRRFAAGSRSFTKLTRSMSIGTGFPLQMGDNFRPVNDVERLRDKSKEGFIEEVSFNHMNIVEQSQLIQHFHNELKFTLGNNRNKKVYYAYAEHTLQ